VPYVRLNHAGRIHYAERGERRKDRPSAVLIHGAGASSAIWSMVLARLAGAAHVVAVDLPGHGPSSAEGTALDGSTGLSLARYRDAVGELAGTLCLGPSVLVGHSMGALVAIEAAAAWPDKVRSLVLCAAAPRLPVAPELAALLRDDPTGVAAWLAERGLACHRGQNRPCGAVSSRRPARSRRPTSRAPISRSSIEPMRAPR
jgi:pimeloyl-ACP methyl ester carboxylesterase